MYIDPDLRNVIMSFMFFVCHNIAILMPKMPLPCLPRLSAGKAPWVGLQCVPKGGRTRQKREGLLRSETNGANHLRGAPKKLWPRNRIGADPSAFSEMTLLSQP
jgi:hypothetical protein